MLFGGVSPNRRKFRHAKSEPAADTRNFSLLGAKSALRQFSAIQVFRLSGSWVPSAVRGEIWKQPFEVKLGIREADIRYEAVLMPLLRRQCRAIEAIRDTATMQLE